MSFFSQHICIVVLILLVLSPYLLFHQLPAFLIQEGWRLQPDLLKQQRNTAGYRCWGGDQDIGQSTGASRRYAGKAETAVGEGERPRPRRLVVDCRRELLHRPVGEAEAGVQEHPALVTGSWFCTLIKWYCKKKKKNWSCAESSNFWTSLKAPSLYYTLPIFVVSCLGYCEFYLGWSPGWVNSSSELVNQTAAKSQIWSDFSTRAVGHRSTGRSRTLLIWHYSEAGGAVTSAGGQKGFRMMSSSGVN